MVMRINPRACWGLIYLSFSLLHLAFTVYVIAAAFDCYMPKCVSTPLHQFYEWLVFLPMSAFREVGDDFPPTGGPWLVIVLVLNSATASAVLTLVTFGARTRFRQRGGASKRT